MKIAYIILAHKLPEQLVRLVLKLNTDGSSFFIHVDKKTDDETYRLMRDPVRAYENVRFLKRLVINYANFSHLLATLEGIQEVVASGVQYDYVILLTGQDYPIKSNEYIQQFLEERHGKSFIEYFSLPSSEHWQNEDGGLDRVNYWHFNIFGRSFAFLRKGQSGQSFLDLLLSSLSRIFLARRRLPLDYQLFGGSAYWCLSKECIEYLEKFIRENPGFVRFFRHVLIPDEIFIQTVLLNSHLRDTLVNDNMRCINWSGNWHPDIFKMEDFNVFIKTDGLFARKFDMSVDSKVFDKIDQASMSFHSF
jgi:hypothetical protein